jgi:hypothetical protein
MKSTVATVLFFAGLALAVTGCAAGADGPAEGTQGTQATARVSPQQQRLADTTLALEMAYDVQFVGGRVDRDSLQPMIDDVLQAAPEGMRSRAQAHIYDVISRGEKDASEMTPEQRARVAAPVSADEMGPQQVDVIGAWGWGMPAFGGWGLGGLGLGGIGAAGLGWGGGFGTTAAWGSSATWGTATSFGTAGLGFPGWGGGIGWGAGWAPGWGAAGWTPALGAGWGLGWGGLGAFGFPAFFGGGLGVGFGAGWGVGVPGGWGF